MKPIYLIFAIAITIIIVILMFGFKVFENSSIESLTAASKVKATINIGVDSWAGYSVLCSKKMRQLSLDKGVLVKCHDDKGNYEQRLTKLSSNELQAAAFSVDGYYLTGSKIGYPGQIVMIIDESFGGDGIISGNSRIRNINDIKGMNQIRIAYTPNTPSQTLLTAWALDFDIPIKDINRIILTPTNGSEEARTLLQQGKVDIAVLWEPDVSIALSNGNNIKLIGSENIKNLIVDSLVINERFLLNNSEYVNILLISYFEALEYFKSNSTEFDTEISAHSKVSIDKVENIKNGIKWVDLPHNGLDWFGLDANNIEGQYQLFETMNSAIRLYEKSGDIINNPLPNRDPLRIINATMVTNMFNMGIENKLPFPFLLPQQTIDYSISRPFSKLTPGAWSRLRVVGSFKIEDITFSTGGFDLDPPEQDAFKTLVNTLQTYPNYRIRIVGHTGQRGDNDANMILSKKRAMTTRDYLVDKFGIDPNRIYAYGVGSQEPPVLLPGQEKDRGYYRSWPRVEIRLVEGG